MIINHHPIRRLLLAVAAAVATLALLAACGSDGDTSSDESSDDAEAASTTAPTTTPTTAAPTTAAAVASGAVVAEFTDCMSNAGVELPELELNEDGLVGIGQLLTAIDIQSTSTQLALFSCQSSLDAATGGGIAQLLASPALQEALTEVSACVREGGYAVPDLTVASALSGVLSGGGTGDTNGLLAAAFGLDASDPEVMAVIESCAGDIESRLNDLGLG